MNKSEQMAVNLTVAGIEGCIRHAKRSLASLAEMDCQFGETGAEPRALSRVAHQENLLTAQVALMLRVAS